MELHKKLKDRTPSFTYILRFPNELRVLITYTVGSFQRLWPYCYTNKYRQIKFRMKVCNKIDTYKDKSTTTINKI